MNTKFAAIIIAFLALFATACSSNEAQSAAPVKQTVQAEGVWTYEENGMKFVATVKANTLEIHWHPDSTTSGLYWKGDFPATELNDGDVISSKADTAALERSMYGAMAETKSFTYKNGALNFEFIIMGTTNQIAMTK